MRQFHQTGWASLRSPPWAYATVIIGVVFGIVHVIHASEMLYYGLFGIVLEAVIPLCLASGLAVTGPWLARNGYSNDELRRVVVWMVVVGLLVALLFGWALSHQVLVGLPFPHAEFVLVTNVTGGALLGTVVGVYDVHTRRHSAVLENERETILQQTSRLSVLNRVLQHNIRNDANIVQGATHEITRRGSAEVQALAEHATETTANIVSLSEKARHIERMIDVDPEDFSEVDVGAVITETLTHCRTSSSVQASALISDDLSPIVTNAGILRSVLDEIFANAIEHTGTDPTQIVISAEPRADGGARIEVGDNGNGLPEFEREGLAGEVETPLEHTSRLGLWLIRWGTRAVGGEVEFGESEAGGTAVRINLPADGRPTIPDPVPDRSSPVPP